jgi:cellulose synthase (UDP-forming)
VAITLLAAAFVAGLVRLATGTAPTVQGVLINLIWVLYDLVVLSVVIEAGRYRGPESQEAVQ